MPTVLNMRGWRLFFYANENQEPIHIHAKKAEAECKYWLITDNFDIVEDYAYNLTPRLRREIREIVFSNFELIVEEWNRVLGDDQDAND